MRGSDFTFDCVYWLYYKCHKINLNWNESFIDAPDYLKNKKVTINPTNNNDTCFHYAATVALNHKGIGKKIRREYKN